MKRIVVSSLRKLGRRMLWKRRSTQVAEGNASTEEKFRSRLLDAFESARGVEIEDVFPAGAERAEVHR